jgi:membrane protease YdiL (CAAX protease family)
MHSMNKPEGEPTPSPDAAPQNAYPTHPALPLIIGPDGLRPLWRFAMYIILWKALQFLLGIFLHRLGPHVHPALWLDMIEESGRFAVVAIPAVLMARLERRTFGAYGLPRRDAFGRLFWIGAAWGLAAITLLLLVLRGAGAFYFGRLALHGPRIVKFALFWGVFFLIVGFFEEFLFRGYTLFTASSAIHFWPAAILLSAWFGAVHLENQGENPVGALAAGVIGLFFCLTIRRTGNLWFAIGFHASWDWAESYLYSVPDSGGTVPGHLLSSSLRGPLWLTGGPVGPEGSVLLFVLIGLLWVVFDRLYPEVTCLSKSPPELSS